MKLEGTLLVVKDTAVSRRFYEEVMGRTVILDLQNYMTFEGGFCIMEEKTWAEFLQQPQLKVAYGHNSAQLGFETEDIDSFVSHMAKFKNIQIITPLTEAPWGQRSIHFYDPDQHLIEVGEDMKVVVKRFLKSGLTIEQTTAKTMYPQSFVEMCHKEL